MEVRATADPDTVSGWTLSFIFVKFMAAFLTAGGIVLLSTVYIKSNIDVTDPLAEIGIFSMLVSPNSVSMVDPITGKVNILQIDPSRISQTTVMNQLLNSSFNQGSFRIMAAKLEFLDINGEAFNHNGKPIEPIYLRKELFIDEWGPLLEKRIKGIGGVNIRQKKIYALYRDDGRFKEGMIRITMIVPNS